MIFGDIVLIPFPFSELTDIKARPALVLAHTKDKFKDVIVCAISSVVPSVLTKNEIILLPSSDNKLKVKSVLKMDRIVTLKKESIITTLGKLDNETIIKTKSIFCAIID